MFMNGSRSSYAPCTWRPSMSLELGELVEVALVATTVTGADGDATAAVIWQRSSNNESRSFVATNWETGKPTDETRGGGLSLVLNSKSKRSKRIRLNQPAGAGRGVCRTSALPSTTTQRLGKCILPKIEGALSTERKFKAPVLQNAWRILLFPLASRSDSNLISIWIN